jgi:hypothetical protein
MNLLRNLIDLYIPLTFRQDQGEIPSESILIDYNDVLLIDKQVVVDENKLIIEAGQKKIETLEEIKKQRTAHMMLKWEIEKLEVDKTNYGEMIQEYKLFRPTKEDHEMIGGGGKNRNERIVKSLRSSLELAQSNHVSQVNHAKKTLLTLKRRISN